MIVIVDFGSQTTHLIGRRLREMGQKVTIITPEEYPLLKEKDIQGFILSGGPGSVYEKDAPMVDKKIFEEKVPILGICYGQQLTAHLLGGRVKKGTTHEYGPANITRVGNSKLLKDTGQEYRVWMSHGDAVTSLPAGFEKTAESNNIEYAAIENSNRNIYCIQFHPEVVHTQFGEQILINFLELCGIKPKKHEIDENFVQSIIADIKDSIKDGSAICALSGGVDSSVAAVLVHKAIGKNLTSLYIDSGLMREGETDALREVFKDHFHMNVKIIDAKDEFLKALKGVVDPEKKRKVIGRVFIEVFEKEAKKLGATFLVQGTIYPDVIESRGSKHADNIKSHHNVGGLPEKMNLALVEPLRTFYKDEVRKIGKLVGLPDSVVQRHPFPGPALAVRIIGDVTEEKLKMVRHADAIVREEVSKAGLDKILWQVFAVLTGIKTTGTRGDKRAYGETVAIRAVESKDVMTAHFARLDYNILDKIATRIGNEIRAVNRVVYDITNKPPSTIEWE